MKGMVARLDPEDVDGWEAFDALEPLGTGRLFDVLADIGCAVAAQKGVEISPQDFLPWLKKIEREKSSGEQLNELRNGLRLAYGA